jgi:Raf kinase inhibitor-like YbhB/YbcL family protein
MLIAALAGPGPADAQTPQGGAGRSNQGQPAATPPPPMRLAIASVPDGGVLPAKFTCAAQPPAHTSPTLSWTDAPPGTQSFVVYVHNMDPRPAKGIEDVLHWLMWNIPANARSIPENVPPAAELPDGSRQLVTAGRNGGPSTGYRAPCPPPGVPANHYAFEVFALDNRLEAAVGATRADVLKAMDGHVLGHAIVIALFGRPAVQQ